MAGLRLYLLLGSLLVGAGAASAQTFGDSAADKPVIPTSGIRVETPAAKAQISDEAVGQALQDEQDELKANQKLIDSVFLPGGGTDVLSRPTEDGSQRGGMAVVEVNDEGKSRRAEKIFLYYENFKLSGYMGGAVSCDARFIVLTNLDRKLTSLDIKLVWPGLTTALSFSNVMPNTPTYLDYTLLGNGCYNMDKMPNIVVNRCRVRGMNSADCADKIVWLSGANSGSAK